MSDARNQVSALQRACGKQERQQRGETENQISEQKANIVQNTYAGLQLKPVPHFWPHLL